MKPSKELKAKRARLVAYCMDSPSLTLDVDYQSETQRLDWHRKNVALLTPEELEDWLLEVALEGWQP